MSAFAARFFYPKGLCAAVVQSLFCNEVILTRLTKPAKKATMATPDFPNGFESWQRTHFEVVEVLVYMRNLEEDKKPKSFAEMVDQSATEELYNLALTLTNKFEEETKGKERQHSLFDEIEDFVWAEVKGL